IGPVVGYGAAAWQTSRIISAAGHIADALNLTYMTLDVINGNIMSRINAPDGDLGDYPVPDQAYDHPAAGPSRRHPRSGRPAAPAPGGWRAAPVHRGLARVALARCAEPPPPGGGLGHDEGGSCPVGPARAPARRSWGADVRHRTGGLPTRGGRHR